MSDARAQTRPGVDRPVTRADLEAKFQELRGATEPGAEKAKGVGIGAIVIGGVLLVLVAYLLGRRKGRRRRTIVEVRRV
ncbi:MAG TPA: hypothetical protein VGK05_09185 [Acidimicrobiia bacterium]|jgi:hypothetical protein